jgi:nitrite reductase/ring-hydroxylating ferredoxin subunit
VHLQGEQPFVRYRFAESFAGAPANAPPGPSTANPPTTASTRFGFLPAYEPGSFDVFNADQRQLAALALARGGEHPLPDLVVLQEIESLIALRVFNERYLGGYYTEALLVDSRDYRQIDVGVLAAPTVQLDQVRIHVDLLAKPGEQFKPDWPWQFSRDCLEVEVRLAGGRPLIVFVNHFKSKFVQPRPGESRMTRVRPRRWSGTPSRRSSDPGRSNCRSVKRVDDEGVSRQHEVGPVADLPTWAVVGGGGYAVGNIDGELFAVSRRCRHLGADLANGTLDEHGHLVCPWHESVYDVHTSRMVRGPQGVFAKVPGWMPHTGR